MTAGLEIPETGLSLRPRSLSEDAAAKPAQIMRLNLVQNTLDDLIHSLRNDQTARVRLGKHPSLHFAGKTQSFHAYPETHRSEIYHSSSDNQNIYFSGVLSHSLEVERAKEAMAASDDALATLEESLQAFEKGKESKTTTLLRHPDEYKAIRAAGGGKNSSLDRNRGLLKSAANRSLTASPPLGAAKSPAALTPTSAPASQTKNNTRQEALKTPFIHLLAVRAVSTKFLSRQTRSSIEDCTALAQKYGIENRLNREKFDLKDKTFKDLDVWKFPYPTQEDRQQAIENAISAFDRMRISRSDKLWQQLLPKEERGKGKCLSRLNLGNGPIKKPATPRPVDGADDRKDGEEVDRASGSGVTQKADTASQKARPEKPASKQTAGKQPAKAKNTNSTLTGRVTKKTAEKKTPTKQDTGKFKSSEFIHSSDEESDVPDASPPSPPAQPKVQKKAPVKKAPAPAPAQRTAPPKAQAPLKRPAESSTSTPTSKVPKSEAPVPKLESSTNASKKSASRLSTSPQKPSPLGSSPPTNASDDGPGRSRSDSHNNSSSSSSSSPLISQLARANKSTGSAVRKPAAQTNGVSKPAASANPLKRKAEPERQPAPAARTSGNLDHKRRRAISTSSGGSTGSASPPMSEELARQKLREKSQDFKRKYQKYLNFHRKLEAQTHPEKADLELLQKQHDRLEVLKQEIWDEDRRLRRESRQ